MPSGHSKTRRRPTSAPPLARPSGSASPRGIRRLFYFIVLRVCLPGQTRFSFLQNAGDVLLSHVRRRCAAIGGLWRPQPASIYSNLPRPASSPSPPQTRQICRVVGVALNDPKRLNLTLSPPHARPAGAKSADGHPPAFSATSMLIQPLHNHFPTPMRTRPTGTQPQPFHNHFPNHPATAFQPRANHREPQPAHNRPSTATQPRANHNHASSVFQSHSSRPKPPDGRSRAWQTPTTQPYFVSNPRAIADRVFLVPRSIRKRILQGRFSCKRILHVYARVAKHEPAK